MGKFSQIIKKPKNGRSIFLVKFLKAAFLGFLYSKLYFERLSKKDISYKKQPLTIINYE